MAELKLNIKIGNLNEIKKQLGGIPIGGGGGGSSSADKPSKGDIFIGNFMAQMVSQLDVVKDLMKVLNGIVNSLVAPFVPFLLAFLKPVTVLLGIVLGYLLTFLKNPAKALINLGVFIINGIIGGLEYVVNGIRNIFGASDIELPRFQAVLVEEAFRQLGNDLEVAASDGTISVKESMMAYQDFTDGLANAFITNSTFTKIVDDAMIAGLTEAETLALIVDVGATTLQEDFINAYAKMTDLSDTIEKRAQELIDKINKASGKKLDKASAIRQERGKQIQSDIQDLVDGRISQSQFNENLNNIKGVTVTPIGDLGSNTGSGFRLPGTLGTVQTIINIAGSVDRDTLEVMFDKFKTALAKTGRF